MSNDGGRRPQGGLVRWSPGKDSSDGLYAYNQYLAEEIECGGSVGEIAFSAKNHLLHQYAVFGLQNGLRFDALHAQGPHEAAIHGELYTVEKIAEHLAIDNKVIVRVSDFIGGVGGEVTIKGAIKGAGVVVVAVAAENGYKSVESDHETYVDDVLYGDPKIVLCHSMGGE